MKTKIILFKVILLISFYTLTASEIPQRPLTDANIYGHVVDARTGEHLPFVNILIKGTRIGTTTDASGHYILTNLPLGEHTIIAVSMGYSPVEVNFTAIGKKTLELDLILTSTGINLDEIVLTASPTASGFRYQPDAVLLGEQLQKKGEVSFGEMLNGQPGVAMRSFGSAPARPVIRGLDGDRILILENGERMGDISETSADHAISMDPLVANRVEVVRGPASLLYGSSALGGVINLMTSDIPDDAPNGTNGVLSMQGATMNNMGAGFAKISHGNGVHAGTARFSFRQAGNITTPEGELPGTSLRNYNGAAGWGFNKEKSNGGLTFSLFNQQFEIPESIENPDERVEIRANRQSLQGRFGKEYESFFDKAQLRFNITRFEQDEVEIETLSTGADEESVELTYGQYALNSTLTVQHKARRIFDRGAIGASLQAKILDVDGADVYTPGEQRLTAGVFTFQEIPLSNIMRLQFGVRFDIQNVKARRNTVFTDINLSRTSVNYSGSIGLNHRPLPGFEIGGQFARSHRNPSIEELFANGPHLGAGTYEIGNTNLKDEIGNGGDFFIRYNRNATTIELASFVNFFRNFIIFQPTGEIEPTSGYPIFRYEGDEAMLLGGEIMFNTSITEKLELTSTLDYVNGRRTVNGKSNEFLPMIPPFRFSVELEYDYTFGWLGTKMQAVAKQDKVAPDEDMTNGYMLLSFTAGFRLNKGGRHVLILRLDNALNENYRDHLSRIEDRGFPMPGRNLNVSYRWFF
ncbi:MAG: TonB-dependent receptor [Bacteroidales bacterium]|nr:TonB-dependent receptor [Bacteroidales bacterium]